MKSQHFSITVLKAKEDEKNKIILGVMKHSCVVFEEYFLTLSISTVLCYHFDVAGKRIHVELNNLPRIFILK